ncbi:MAG: chemotaxis response regulator protein-glutamate methylesterase [Actinobacteria bacterium]|nr:chemotaxis response regulator protein-glutamate methylesterase [Actinomycetota bacterium]
MKNKIRVLVVDDSAFIRDVVRTILEADSGIEVIGFGADGFEAIEKIKDLRPDVVTLDIDMPRMNGLVAIKNIMEENPARIVVLTGLTDQEVTLDALRLGAIDFLIKPSGSFSRDLDTVGNELIEKVKIAAGVDLEKIKPIKTVSPVIIKPVLPYLLVEKIIVIGSSTGGPSALETIISAFPKDFNIPVLVVQHLPEGFTEYLVRRLDSISQLVVKIGKNGDVLKRGEVIVAPANYHMTVNKVEYEGTSKSEKVIYLDQAPPIMGLRPSVDKTMKSAAKIYGSNTVGVLLTGMGRDGAIGLKAIKDNKGRTIAQDEASSVVFGMAKVAVSQGYVDVVASLEQIADEIIKAVS